MDDTPKIKHGPSGRGNMRGSKLRKKETLKPRWDLFLRSYCDPASPAFSSVAKASEVAGFTKQSGYQLMRNLKETKNKAAIKIFEEFGFTKLEWVNRIIQAINSNDELGNPTTVAMKGMQMYGLMAGESVSDKTAVTNVSFNAPTMLIIGATDDRFKQLEAGSKEDEAIDTTCSTETSSGQ